MARKTDCGGAQCVFVAGAAEDAAARRIADMLRRKNYAVLWGGGIPAAGGDKRRDAASPCDLAAIAGCGDFVVVLGKGALAELKDPASGLSREVRRAMQRQRNVVPVLPDGIGGAELAELAGTPDLAEETYDFAALEPVEESALESRLVSRPCWSRKLTVLAAAVAAATVALGAMLLYDAFAGFPKNARERELASQLCAAVESSVACAESRSEGAAATQDLVRSLDGTGVDTVALARILAPTVASRATLLADVEKVLGAVHSEEAAACLRRVKAMLEGTK